MAFFCIKQGPRQLAKASKTAEIVTAVRAKHTKYDDPVILNDPYAIKLCGPFWSTVVRFRILKWLMFDKILAHVSPAAPEIIVRADYGEQHAKNAIVKGVDQYVICGAGYDSFAMRRTDLTKNLTVYEVDTPSSQAEKRRRMKKAGIAEPECVRYVAADFNKESLEDTLARSGFDSTKPAFFSWFGVSYYLSPESVWAMLDYVANRTAKGSAIAFDYVCHESEIAESDRQLMQNLAKFVAKRGEPWLTHLKPSTLPSELLAAGFTEIDHVPPADISSKLVKGHKDLQFPPILAVCTAMN